MRRHRALSFGLWLGLTLVPGLGIVPAPMMVAAEPPIVGAWEGTLDPGAQAKKRILVHISTEGDGSLKGTIDYPDQSVSGIGITAITYTEPTLHFESSSMQASYDGAMNQDNSEITGTWKQGGATLSLILRRVP
jgi:hypothetical protein